MTPSSGPTGPFELAAQAATELNRWAGGSPHDVAVVLGSGWQAVADGLGTPTAERASGDLPGFVAPTVAGHHGRMCSLNIGDHRGPSPHRAHPPLRRSFAGLGGPCGPHRRHGRCRRRHLDQRRWRPRPGDAAGQAVLIRDQLNLTGASPLSGASPPEGYRGRFVDLTELYPAKLRELAKTVDPTLGEGVYAGLNGPQYETPAEVAMLRSLGADLVGMSTALEAIAAHHLGAEVLGISLVTNLAAGVSPTPLDHAEVLAAGAAAAPYLVGLISGVLKAL